MSEPPGMTFDQWLEAWKDEILQTTEFTKSDMPTMAAEIQTDLNRTTRDYPRMAELLAEVEQHISNCRAQETLHVKGDPKYADFTSPERKTVVDSRISHIIRTRDILKTTCRALEERSFCLMGQRRYAEAELRMTGRGEAE